MEGDCKMKTLFKTGLIGALLFSGIAMTSTETMAAAQPEEETNIITYGAGEWDYLGWWNVISNIRVTSGGGDLKVCLPDLGKTNVSLDSYLTLQKDQQTDGIGDNCTIFRNIGPRGGYDISFTDGPLWMETKMEIYD